MNTLLKLFNRKVYKVWGEIITMIKTKSLHRIIIDNILIRTTLQYNLNTNHYSITTYYPIQNKNKIKKYYDQNKNKIDEYQKEY